MDHLLSGGIFSLRLIYYNFKKVQKDEKISVLHYNGYNLVFGGERISVKVIIDAYNVLHQMHAKRVADAERKQFINLLGAYAKRKHLEVIVVFDAGPFLFPSTEVQKGITIKYSGPKDSADDIIVRIMQQCHGQGMILVSSDRELRNAAKKYNAESIPSPEFIERLLEREPEKKRIGLHQAVKVNVESDPLVDVLMQQVRVSAKADDVSPHELPDRRAAGHKESKKERLRSQKIKKL
jgi:predicted RNA-binding protein with PIN domain